MLPAATPEPVEAVPVPMSLILIVPVSALSELIVMLPKSSLAPIAPVIDTALTPESIVNVLS